MIPPRTEEGQPGQYLNLIASGEVDAVLLDALATFVEGQRSRLKLLNTSMDDIVRPPGMFAVGEAVPVSGNYWIEHPNGHAARERVVLQAGNRFLPCTICGDGAYYKQVQIGE